jgi:hypothetical protein
MKRLLCVFPYDDERALSYPSAIPLLSSSCPLLLAASLNLFNGLVRRVRRVKTRASHFLSPKTPWQAFSWTLSTSESHTMIVRRRRKSAIALAHPPSLLQLRCHSTTCDPEADESTYSKHYPPCKKSKMASSSPHSSDGATHHETPSTNLTAFSPDTVGTANSSTIKQPRFTLSITTDAPSSTQQGVANRS